MCVALPGKVLRIDNGIAECDFSGNKVNVQIGLVNAKPGDYVLVHAGCAIQTLKEKEAEEIIELMSFLE